jgi:hypothetical protein
MPVTGHLLWMKLSDHDLQILGWKRSDNQSGSYEKKPSIFYARNDVGAPQDKVKESEVLTEKWDLFRIKNSIGLEGSYPTTLFEIQRLSESYGQKSCVA